MPPAIRIENLGKRYLVDHEARSQRGGYKTLRESLADAASVPFRRLASCLRPSPQSLAPSPFRRREEFWALKDVSFEVQPGEVVGIIGRNGAGKSTLLKILSQITRPTRGRIELRGRVGSLLEVGTGFHPELTGRENIYLNGSILGMRKREIDRKFDEIVAFAEIEQFLDTPVKRYSSGMYVRLAFAVAAHLEPEILIIDEVLAVGDIEFQKRCLGRMKDVASKGRTVLFVSHNLDAVNQLTRRCVHLSDGVVQAAGETHTVITRYVESLTCPSRRGHYSASFSSGKNKVITASVHTTRAGGLHDWAAPIAFEFTLSINRPSRGLTFSFQVMDTLGQPIGHFWLIDDRVPYTKLPGEYTLHCHVPSLRLYMGDYYLKTWLSDSTTREQYEVLEGICPFQVTMEHSPRKSWPWAPGECKYIDHQTWSILQKTDHPDKAVRISA